MSTTGSSLPAPRLDPAVLPVRGRTGGRSLALAVLIGSLGLAAPCQAGGDDSESKAAAKRLFTEGQKLLVQNELDGACRKFEASLVAYSQSVATRTNLALCYQRQGKTFSAYQQYELAYRTAREIGDDRARDVLALASELVPRLSRLTIAPSSQPPGFAIRCGHEIVAPSSYGVAVAMDPGQYQIRAEAPGYESWARTVELGRRAAREHVIVPALVKLAQPVEEASKGESATQRTAAPVWPGALLVGAGGATVIAGAAVLGAHFGDVADADHLQSKGDKAGSDAAVDRANIKQGVGGGLLGLGAAATAVGIYLLVTRPAQTNASHASAQLEVSVQSDRVVMTYRF